MARIDTLDNFLTDVADSIRAKKGTSEPIVISEFDTEIASIPSGGGSSFAPTYGISFNTNYNSASGYDTTTTSLDFTGLDTSKMASMRKMFCNMRALTSLNLSGFDTSSAVDLSYMFSYCSALASIIFGNNWDTSKVTNMSNLFQRCTSLTNIDLSKWNTSKVTNMANMFNNTGTTGTLSITYGNNWDTSSVTNMGSMFQGVKNTSLDLSNYNTSSVTNMNSMFNGCNALTSLDLSSFNTSNLTTMNNVFSGCTALTSNSITYGNNWNTSKVTNMSYLFQNCTSLVHADLSKYNFTNNLTNIDYMFNGCTNLEKITFGKLHSQCTPTKTNTYKNCSNLKEIVIDEYVDDPYSGSSESNYIWGFFEGIKNQIETLTVNKFIAVDSVISFGSMQNLKVLNLGNINFDNTNKREIMYTFKDNSSLTSLDLRTVSISNTSSFTEWFENDRSLTSIIFGDYFITDNAEYMTSMFRNCSSLTSLDLSTFNTKKIKRIYNLFSGCTNLETITFGNNFTLESIENSSVSYTYIVDMFKNCTKLDNNTLNQILYICTTINPTYTGPRTLAHLGIDSTFVNFANIPTLSNYQDFLDAGWTIS